MTAEEYAAAQSAITAAAAAYTMQYVGLFVNPALSLVEWVALLKLLYPQVEKFREQSAELARTFYDEQREDKFPDLPRNDRLLEPFEFDWFVQSMEPVREQIMVAKSPPAAAPQFTLQVVREVENAGRRQIIHASENDEPLKEFIRLVEEQSPEVEPVYSFEKQKVQWRYTWPEVERVDDTTPIQTTSRPSLSVIQTETRPVMGWARVATGRETCAWCLMLVSRGAVYHSAFSAGLKLDEESAADAIKSGEDVSEFMNEWHVGCDCQVVPVFDLEDWPGKDAAASALELWVQAGKRASAELAENPDKKYYSFNEKRWLPTTDNRETINQLRKMIDAGEISSQQWAALSEAA